MQSSIANNWMDDVTDPSDWKDDFALLRNLDASLRCDLCFVCIAPEIFWRSLQDRS